MKRQRYEKEFKEKLIKLHLEQGRTVASIEQEYSLSKNLLHNWIRKYREEGQYNPEIQKEFDIYEELAKLKKEKMELEKENAFLKKAAAFFAKELD